MAYVEQFAWAAENLLQGDEFALFFAYGDDGSWSNYDISNSAIPALLEAKARVTQEHPVTPVQPPAAPPNPPPPIPPSEPAPQPIPPTQPPPTVTPAATF